MGKEATQGDTVYSELQVWGCSVSWGGYMMQLVTWYTVRKQEVMDSGVRLTISFAFSPGAQLSPDL